MLFRKPFGRAFLFCLLASLALTVAVQRHARAQDDDPTLAPTVPEKHGRKYRPPPETSHIEVTVLKGFNKKPVVNAAVVFHPIKDGKDEGNLELKTDPDGKAVIDVIPKGSQVRIQVIADGFSTFADDYKVDEASRSIVIQMVRPRAQISAYIDNDGKPAQLKPGVQEPVRPKLDAKGNPMTPPATGASAAAGSSSAAGPSTSTTDSRKSGAKPQP
jgi:hypothetical protein